MIFTTAYDRFALDAFQALAVDYLLKPVSDAALSQALGKLQRLQPREPLDASPWLARASANAEPGRWRQRMMGRKGSAQFHPLPIAQIAYLVSLDKLTHAVMADGVRYLIESTLSELEAELDPARFFRVNRQLLLAAQAVRHYSPAGKGRLTLNLVPGTAGEVLVSQERAALF